MTDWSDLKDELQQWARNGLRPRLWWRDDDAQEVTPDLERLLSLSDNYAVPAHIAVIPDGLHPDLAERLNKSDHAWVLQHGLRHINHEPKGHPASEVGDTRDLNAQRADLSQGWDILRSAGFARLLPGFVPPWNRIGDETRKHLPAWGYRYLSNYEGRGDSTAVPGLLQVDAHLDPIRWKYDRIFRGEAKMLDMLITHLRIRREADPAAPIGYVTHHLQTAETVWAFTEKLFARTGGLWVSLPDIGKG